MIPFSELQMIQAGLSAKKGAYVGVTVFSHCYPANGRIETNYTFYMYSKTVEFKTAQELRAYMENLLTPAVDAGVELEG